MTWLDVRMYACMYLNTNICMYSSHGHSLAACPHGVYFSLDSGSPGGRSTQSAKQSRPRGSSMGTWSRASWTWAAPRCRKWSILCRWGGLQHNHSCGGCDFPYFPVFLFAMKLIHCLALPRLYWFSCQIRLEVKQKHVIWNCLPSRFLVII